MNGSRQGGVKSVKKQLLGLGLKLRACLAVLVVVASVQNFTNLTAAVKEQSQAVGEVGEGLLHGALSYELARKESFGFFDNIEAATWKRHQHRARTEPLYSDPYPNDSKDGALWYLENLDPIFTCPNVRRVGGRGDGPKWVCDPHRLMKEEKCLIYSIGSKGVYKFEDALVGELGTHCEIHVFDPSPLYARPNDPKEKNIHYHPWGLKAAEGKDPSTTIPEFRGLTFLSLPAIMKRLGHTGRTIHIFKIDCEGCEKTAFVDFLTPTIDIQQILIETHFFKGYNITTFFNRFFDQNFVLYSREINTHPHAVPMGTLIEWSFIRLHPNFLQRSKTKGKK